MTYLAAVISGCFRESCELTLSCDWARLSRSLCSGRNLKKKKEEEERNHGINGGWKPGIYLFLPCSTSLSHKVYTYIQVHICIFFIPTKEQVIHVQHPRERTQKCSLLYERTRTIFSPSDSKSKPGRSLRNLQCTWLLYFFCACALLCANRRL